MDRLQRSFFQLAARCEFMRLRRTAFQDWFCRIMGLAHSGDFISVRLTQGDGGLDGFRLSTSTVYQAYAPRDLSPSDTVAKIGRDFEKARSYLKGNGVSLKGWVFVHNDEDGLAPEVTAKVGALKQDCDTDGVLIQVWAFESIWQTILGLTTDQLVDLFGAGPVEDSLKNLGIPDIVAVVERLHREAPPPIADMSIPDPKKLEFNQLSQESRDWLILGRSRVSLVPACFSVLPNPEIGERIGEAFRKKYRELRGGGMEADAVFATLWEFAGGGDFVRQTEQAAIAAIMAHFFNACDIFENAPTNS